VVVMGRLMNARLYWPVKRRLSSATSSWALYFTYLTVIGTAMLGWLWLLVWCVWKLV
jgi:hypothetical protein